MTKRQGCNDSSHDSTRVRLESRFFCDSTWLESFSWNGKMTRLDSSQYLDWLDLYSSHYAWLDSSHWLGLFYMTWRWRKLRITMVRSTHVTNSVDIAICHHCFRCTRLISDMRRRKNKRQWYIVAKSNALYKIIQWWRGNSPPSKYSRHFNYTSKQSKQSPISAKEMTQMVK